MTTLVRTLDSAGRTLTVMDDGRLAHWWPNLSRHVPGSDTILPVPVPKTIPTIDMTGFQEPSEARRVINAHLHLLHLEHDTLSVHAAALISPCGEGSVLLLGGHGTGKTLVATALALKGWAPIAGDVTLVRVRDEGPMSVGGTTAFMVRTVPTARWFPHLPLPDRTVTDLGHLWTPAPDSVAAPVLAAVWVRVDGDPHLDAAAIEPLDVHTAHTLWWTAGAHLVDRVAAGDPLRLLEDTPAMRHRADLTRTLTEQMVPMVMWGDPHMIASAITRFALNGGKDR